MRSFTLVAIVLVFACSNSIRNASDECSAYYKFLGENWVQLDDGKLLYGFKGNPEYWKDETKKYFRRDCIVGLNKRQIAKLLGQPSKSFLFYDSQIAFYCMEEGCLKLMKNSSKEFVINYDANDIVIEAYLNPLGVDSD